MVKLSLAPANFVVWVLFSRRNQPMIFAVRPVLSVVGVEEASEIVVSLFEEPVVEVEDIMVSFENVIML